MLKLLLGVAPRKFLCVSSMLVSSSHVIHTGLKLTITSSLFLSPGGKMDLLCTNCDCKMQLDTGYVI